MSLHAVGGPAPHVTGMVIVCRTCGLQPWSCLRAQWCEDGPHHTQTLTRVPAAQARATAAEYDAEMGARRRGWQR